MPEVTLGDVLSTNGGSIKTGPFGTALKANEYSSDGVPLISVGEVGHGRLRLRQDTPRIGSEVLVRLPEYVLQAGDIVFGRKGAVDRSAWVKPEESGYFLGSDGIRVRFDDDSVDSRFMAYQFQSERVRKWLVQHAAGTTMASLNQGVLERTPIVLPPLTEQRAIAEVLGALDDKIAANSRSASTSHELAEVLYARGVKALPTVKMSEQLESVLGGTPKRSEDRYWNGDIPWASAKDVASADLGVVLRTSESITTQATRETKAKPLPAGSVVLTARGTVGAVARLGVPAAINQSCYGFVPGALPKSVLYFAVRSIADQARSLAHGSVFDTITRRTFDFVEVPDGENPGITNLEDELVEILTLGETKIREGETLAATRDALLPLLMSGKVTVKDAEAVVEEAV